MAVILIRDDLAIYCQDYQFHRLHQCTRSHYVIEVFRSIDSARNFLGRISHADNVYIAVVPDNFHVSDRGGVYDRLTDTYICPAGMFVANDGRNTLAHRKLRARIRTKAAKLDDKLAKLSSPVCRLQHGHVMVRQRDVGGPGRDVTSYWVVYYPGIHRFLAYDTYSTGRLSQHSGAIMVFPSQEAAQAMCDSFPVAAVIPALYRNRLSPAQGACVKRLVVNSYCKASYRGSVVTLKSIDDDNVRWTSGIDRSLHFDLGNIALTAGAGFITALQDRMRCSDVLIDSDVVHADLLSVNVNIVNVFTLYNADVLRVGDEIRSRVIIE